MPNWSHIQNALKKIYEDQKILEFFENDSKYLQKAFEKTEFLWKIQFDNIRDINYLMISEAPLFGDSERYIYNINTAPSSFFYYNNLLCFPSVTSLKKTNSKIEKKKIMFDVFSKNGFLIFDLFPYALNPQDTKINYRNIPSQLYNELLTYCVDSYLLPKLKMCINKMHPKTQIFYRYQRVYENSGRIFENLLQDNCSYEFKIESISGNNIPLDQEKLKLILEKRIS